MDITDFLPKKRIDYSNIGNEAMKQDTLKEMDKIRFEHEYDAGEILGKMAAQSAKNRGAGSSGGMSPSAIGALGNAGASLLGGIFDGGGGGAPSASNFGGGGDFGMYGYDNNLTGNNYSDFMNPSWR